MGPTVTNQSCLHKQAAQRQVNNNLEKELIFKLPWVRLRSI